MAGLVEEGRQEMGDDPDSPSEGDPQPPLVTAVGQVIYYCQADEHHEVRNGVADERHLAFGDLPREGEFLIHLWHRCPPSFTTPRSVESVTPRG